MLLKHGQLTPGSTLLTSAICCLPIQDISTQLSDILDNVNCAINHFQEELGYDLKEKAKPQQPEQKDKKRFILLEKIASFSKDTKDKVKHLYEILRWLGDWGESIGLAQS